MSVVAITALVEFFTTPPSSICSRSSSDWEMAQPFRLLHFPAPLYLRLAQPLSLPDETGGLAPCLQNCIAQQHFPLTMEQ